MITELHARNYGCLRDVVAAHLSPIHAFIGPNDSGKSTLLRAARVLAVFAGDAPNPDLFEMQLESASAETPISLASRTPPGAYRVVFDGTQYPQDGMSEHLGAAPQALPLQKRPWGRPRERARANHGPILGELGPARIVRLDPDHLRQATALLGPGRPLGFENDRGLGLASVLDAIRDRGDDAFEQIRSEVYQLFPEVKRLKFQRGNNVKSVAVQLQDGTEVPASTMSEGLLYFIALATLPHLSPVSLLLVEEPENGLHPARIADVMKVFRAVSKRTQVLIATHSPLVVNELEAHEVSVVTRPKGKGTKVQLLKDTPNYEERSKVYRNGELWLSYCDGDQETPLFREPEEPPDTGGAVEWADDASGEVGA